MSGTNTEERGQYRKPARRLNDNINIDVKDIGCDWNGSIWFRVGCMY
jgi:hypothetical protein